MAASGSQTVVVGVDGSGTDRPALLWAAETASLLGLGLLVVHASESAALGAVEDDPVMASPAVAEALRSQSGETRVTQEAVETVRGAFPDLEVTVEETSGAASSTLLDRQDRGCLLVVGSGRRGSLGDLLLGTTSLNTAMHARRPVAVVGHDVDVTREPRGTVLVALDGSRDSAAAAVVALDQAAARGARVVGVTAWYLEVVDGYVVTEPDSPEWRAIEERQRERAGACLRQARERHPDVPVEIEVLHGPSSTALAARSSDADLLVMGSRGRGGFAGKLLGSVSHKVLRAAQCPVVVVKAPPVGG